MKANKIESSDIKDILISSLPTRPTAPRSLGGMGYGAVEMKSAFDKLPLYIIERYNELVSDILDIGEESLAASVPTGIKDGHTLNELFEDVKTGALATYLTFLGKTLSEHIIYIYEELENIKNAVKKPDESEEKEEANE